MKTLLSVYGINAFAFLSNLAAVFVFLALAGPQGYGTYGIYIVFLAIYYLWEVSLIKTALFMRSQGREPPPGYSDATADTRPVAFIHGSLIPFGLGSAFLIAMGNLLYPVDPATGIGGQLVLVIVALEHLLSYPANRLIYHLTVEKEFRTVYAFRLAATLLRHLFAWGVLFLTGSVFWAIAAILAKGLIVGAVSFWWISGRFRMPARMPMRIGLPDLGMVASFFAAAAIVVVMQELPSLHIDRTYGREALGHYRLLYDVIAVVWFLATVYPTILFSYLLAGRESGRTPDSSSHLIFFADRLSLFHLVYFFGVCALITYERLFLWGYFAEVPYAIGVAAGVAMLGYSRFLIEAAQAYGAGRRVLVATCVTVACVGLVLAFLPTEAGLAEIGWAWLFGQLLFFTLLKINLVGVIPGHTGHFRDTAILIPATLLTVAAHHLLPDVAFLGLCLAGATVSLAALAGLLRGGMTPGT